MIAAVFSRASADTIDYGHVYLNNVKIRDFNQYSNAEIVIKLKNIKKADSLSIFYFRDTPCGECIAIFEVEDSSKLVISKGENTGTFKSIKISVFELLKYTSKNPMVAFYYERLNGKVMVKVQLFKILLE